MIAAQREAAPAPAAPTPPRPRLASEAGYAAPPSLREQADHEATMEMYDTGPGKPWYMPYGWTCIGLAFAGLICAIALFVFGAKDSRIGANPGEAVATINSIQEVTNRRRGITTSTDYEAYVGFTTEDGKRARARIDVTEDEAKQWQESQLKELQIVYNRKDPSEADRVGSNHSTLGVLKVLGGAGLMALAAIFTVLGFVNGRKYGWQEKKSKLAGYENQIAH